MRSLWLALSIFCFTIIVMGAFAMNKAEAYTDKISLNGTWQIYPDIENDVRIIKYDSGVRDTSTVIGRYSPNGKSYIERMVLNIPNKNDVQYAKIMAQIHVGSNLTRKTGEICYCLKVNINDGQWQHVDLREYMDNKTHWIEIPVNNADLLDGDNAVTFDSSIVSSSNMGDDSLDLLATIPGGTTARAWYSNDGVNFIQNSDRHWNVRLQYSKLDHAVWQNIAVPSAWETSLSFDGVKKNFVKVKLNDNEWVSADLSSLQDNANHWIEIPVPISYLKTGNNSIILDSTIDNPGNMQSNTLDVFASGNTPSGKSYWSNDLTNWTAATDRNFNIRLMTYNSSSATWEESKYDNGGTDHTVVIGQYNPNGLRYYERTDHQIGSLFNLSAAKVRIYAHVGNTIDSVYQNPKLFDGVGWYKTDLSIPSIASDEIKWLQFDAADYKLEAWLNGKFIGSHEGGYVPFKFDISSMNNIVNVGGTNTLIVRVTDQFDSRMNSGTGTIPIKETNAGFLQDTIAINYGGIWQDVSLSTSKNIYIENVFMNPDIDNNRAEVRLSVHNKSDTSRTLAIHSDIAPRAGGGSSYSGSSTITLDAHGMANVSFYVNMPSSTLWSPSDPYLYTSVVSVKEGPSVFDSQTVDFGMRKISVSGKKILLNNQNIFLTGMLHWGLYWDTIAETPSVSQVQKEIADLKNAGFNAIKFTLTVPPKYVLDEMDRQGMLAYIEYPIWHPVESDDFFSRSRSNITEMVIKDRNHPSVIMSDFSCEMPTFSPKMDSLMFDLYNMGKTLAPNRLFLDNSSVGMTKYGDFYATHPYYQLNKFKEVIDVWANVRASGGVNKPLILGEYADTDTIRNTTAIKNANGGTLPWWWTMFGTNDPETILQNQGFSLGQIDAFRSSSVANAQMSKKYYIEASKMNSRVAGLFVTHIRDIAQTQAGFYDDNGDLKFDSAELKKSTNPTTLLLERQTLNVWGGSLFTVSPKLSHYDGTAITNGTVAWRLMANGAAVSSGTSQTGVVLANGDVYDLNAITFTTPDSASPYKYTLQVTLTANGGEYLITNDWPVWVYPDKPLSNPDKSIQVYDPANKLDLTTRYPWMTTWANDNPDLLITTDWSSAINSYLNNGGKVLYVGHGTGPVTSNSSTFNIWAYAFIPNEHPALGQFPHEGFSDQQFLDLVTDYSLDYNGFYGGTNLAAHQPIIGRMDLRGYSVSSYLSEFNVGSGQLLQTTLRLDSLAAGGDLAGDLNVDHDARENVAGKYLLDQLLKYELGLVVSGNKAPAANLVETSSEDPTLNGALAIDGIKQIWGSGEWASNGEERPWIKLTWNSGITIESVKLYDRSNPYDNIQSGTLTFSDGSSVSVGSLDNAGAPTTVTFPAKSGITWIKFQVDSSNPGWLNNGLSEIEVF